MQQNTIVCAYICREWTSATKWRVYRTNCPSFWMAQSTLDRIPAGWRLKTSRNFFATDNGPWLCRNTRCTGELLLFFFTSDLAVGFLGKNSFLLTKLLPGFWQFWCFSSNSYAHSLFRKALECERTKIQLSLSFITIWINFFWVQNCGNFSSHFENKIYSVENCALQPCICVLSMKVLSHADAPFPKMLHSAAYTDRVWQFIMSYEALQRIMTLVIVGISFFFYLQRHLFDDVYLSRWLRLTVLFLSKGNQFFLARRLYREHFESGINPGCYCF